MIADRKPYAQPQPDQSAQPAPTEPERTIPVPTGFKPYPEYKDSGLPWLGLCVRNHEISADILAIEKEAEGLLDGLLKVGEKA